jgi:replication factor C large subunit
MPPANAPWAVKYAPTKVADVPQPLAAAALENFIKQFGKKKGLILVGPSGTGKTALVYALAKERGLELIETNASDHRTGPEIESRVGSASRQMSLFGNSKLILVDELDGITGTHDRGGIPALVKVLDQTSFPVIMTCADLADKRYNPLTRLSVVVELGPVDPTAAATIIARIAAAERIKADPALLLSLARRSGGDLRALINDFQALTEGRHELTKAAIDDIASRDKDETIQPALIKVLKNTDATFALNAFDHVDMDQEEALLWVDYNLGKEYKQPADLARAYECLSRADVFLGRIRRWQHWRFLVYSGNLMTGGVASAKDAKYPGAPRFDRSSRLLKIWMANQRNAKRKAVAEKMAPFLHCSPNDVVQHTLPVFRKAAAANEHFAEQLADAFGLDEEQLAWLES